MTNKNVITSFKNAPYLNTERCMLNDRLAKLFLPAIAKIGVKRFTTNDFIKVTAAEPIINAIAMPIILFSVIKSLKSLST